MADITYKQGDVRERLQYFLNNTFNPNVHLLLQNNADVVHFDRDAQQLISRTDFFSLTDPTLEWTWGVFGEKKYICIKHPVFKKPRFIHFYTLTPANELI